MASFLRTTFDSLVNNINTTINQHTNSSPRSTGTPQQQQSRNQGRTRTSSDRPTAGTQNSHGQRNTGFRSNIPYFHQSSRLHQSTPNQQRTTSHQPSGRASTDRYHSHQNPHNTRYTGSNLTTGGGHVNSSATNMSSNTSQQSQQNAASISEKQLDIGDIRDPLDINQLSAKQLKIILTRNCVDYKGVFEKEVLREKVMQLWIDCNEKRTSSKTADYAGSQNSNNDIDDSQSCKICMEREINCVLLECGHMLTCVPCGRKLAECPICRQNISRCVRTFKG